MVRKPYGPPRIKKMSIKAHPQRAFSFRRYAGLSFSDLLDGGIAPAWPFCVKSC
jgi:hypothetical protein